jgi:flagellar M-ring protein FliF
VPDLGGGQPWYESGWLAMILRNVTAIVIALLVLMLGVRPLSKALMKKRDDAGRGGAIGRDLGATFGLNSSLEPGVTGSGPNGQPVSIDALESAQNFDDRIGMVRGFTRDNPTRAALAVRDMIKSDAR